MKLRAAGLLWALLGSLAVSGACASGVIHVHGTSGDDRHAGSRSEPLKTVAKAVELAKPGDTILLVPGQPPIREAVVLNNVSGQEGNPLTLDGADNLLLGSRPLVPGEWSEAAPGIYRSISFGKFLSQNAAGPSEAVLRRFYFLIDGKIQRMGRASKRINRPLPQPHELRPGEWTYIREERAFYLAVESGQRLEEAAIEFPFLRNGVATTGNCSHWVIRNLRVSRFQNDGFNFHGQTSDFLVENCSARECGDDGMSAHEKCEVEVRGFQAHGNSTGICHIGESVTRNRNLVLEGNAGYNLFLLGSGRHEISDSKISARDGIIQIGSTAGGTVAAHFENCEILWPDEAKARPSAFQTGKAAQVSSQNTPGVAHDKQP